MATPIEYKDPNTGETKIIFQSTNALGQPEYQVREANGGIRRFGTLKEAQEYAPDTTDPADNAANWLIADALMGPQSIGNNIKFSTAATLIKKGRNLFSSEGRTILANENPVIEAVTNATPSDISNVGKIGGSAIRQFGKDPLQEYYQKYPKRYPTRDEVLESLRNSEGIESEEEDNVVKFGFGNEGKEGTMYVSEMNPDYWPLTSYGINPPIIVETHMTPATPMEKGTIEVSRAGKLAMVKAQNLLPSGTIFSPDPDAPVTKEMLEQAIIHSNLSNSEKIKLLEQYKDYVPDNIPSMGDYSIDSADMVYSMGRKADRFITHDLGEIAYFNGYAANPNNRMIPFVKPQINSSGRIVGTDIINKPGLNQYIQQTYPHLNTENGRIPFVIIQKRKFGGKIRKFGTK